MTPEEQKKMDSTADALKSKADLYHSLGKNDRQIIDIYHWISNLEEIKDDILENGQNLELEDQFDDIITTLIVEIGTRVVGSLDKLP